MGAFDNHVIISGACGFLGSHLVEELLRRKHDLILFDNKSSGAYANIKDFYTGDIYDLEKLSWYPRIPVVFHLGIPSSYKMFDKNKYLYSSTIRDFINVLEYCKAWNSKLIYASTASLYYGNNIPFKETMIIQPKDLYSECYYEMERLATLYNSLYGLKSIGLRLFNVYGKKEQYKEDNASIIYQITTCIGSGDKPVIYKDGSQTRDFIYIDDVIDALLLCMNSKKEGIFNIGSGETFSFNEIIDLVNVLLDVKIEPEYKKSPIPKYVEFSLADISKARKLLGFNPKVSIEEGTKKVVEECLYKGMFKEK